MSDKQTKGAAAGSANPAPGGKKGEESKKDDVKDVLAAEELVSCAPSTPVTHLLTFHVFAVRRMRRISS